jgi:hypothetical protein
MQSDSLTPVLVMQQLACSAKYIPNLQIMYQVTILTRRVLGFHLACHDVLCSIEVVLSNMHSSVDAKLT